MSREVLPYGSWPSPITADLIVSSAVRLGEVQVDGEDVWWDEGRPAEGGRVQVVRRRRDGAAEDVLPAGFSARTRVHEYGGGAWWVHHGAVYFANWDDQRMYRFDPDADSEPRPLTRDPVGPHGLRYADGRVSGSWIVCVRESHETEGEARNEVVAVRSSGGDPLALVSGPDFVSNPRPSPDGSHLCWLQWNHPAMPWDGTELWVAQLHADDDDIEMLGARRVAGGPSESIFQPEWSPHGVLHFVSDRTGWWALHRFSRSGLPEPSDEGHCIWDVEREVGVAQWVFGLSRYAFVGPDGGEIVASAGSNGVDELWLLDPGRPAEGTPGALAGDETVAERFDSGFTSVSGLASTGDSVAFVGASFASEPAVVEIRIGEARQHRVLPRVLSNPRDLPVGSEWYSVPVPVAFPTVGESAVAHALFYPPRSPAASGPHDELPPLIVQIHGGPTSCARPQLQLGVQYWTSRGFGVVDVNYRGSTGYGRVFRRMLDGAWGVADVQDCAEAAGWLAERGEVDGDRLVIHGGSAGGYTTLCALAFTDRFSAGTSSYGVADLEALARDTHKFESRYLDALVGPYPSRRDLYIERSPIHHVDALDRPLLVLQGLEDEVVPPNQSEMIVDALRQRGVPVAYLAFAGEQHGFRQAETIKRALEAELFFYARVLGFDPPAEIGPVEIQNL